MNADRTAAFDARNAELSSVAQFSEVHKGAYLVYWKKHFPLCYKLTGNFAIVDGTVNLECVRNTAGATFFKATAGSQYFFGSLVMGATVTVYREGAPVSADADYIARILKIVADQRAVPGITVIASIPKPAKTVTVKPATVATPKIAASVTAELANLRQRLFTMFSVDGKIDSRLPIVQSYIKLAADAKILKVSGFKAKLSQFKAEYTLA